MIRLRKHFQQLFTDTIFTRFFGLAIGAVLISHLMTFALVFIFLGQQLPHPPPPSARHAVAAGDWLRQPLTGFICSLILQLLILAIATWFGSRNLAKPIQALAQAAHELSNNLNAPASTSELAESGPKESKQAALVFNKMQRKIREQLSERERFLAAVSHDLRTPLTRMKLRIENLNDLDNLNNTEDKASRTKLLQDVEEMRQMLDATLDYLRSHGQSSQAKHWLDIQALVEAIADDAIEQGQHITHSGSAKPILVVASDIRRCLLNLIDNALSYGRTAHIQLHDHSTALTITICDQGAGIPEESLSRVLEPFYRLATSRNKNSGGVGLGLSITHEIVRQHGGELRLFNNSNGIGLCAEITLPRSQ